MADHLEEMDEKVDANRIMDQADFLANQFEKFTHDFREKGEPACCEMMTESSDLLKAIRKNNSELREIVIKVNEEFSTSTVPIPEYDTVDMKCLLGDDQVPEKKTLLELMKEQQKKDQEELERILRESKDLLNDFEHLKKGIKA
ncbi:Protein CBG07070 [Caenorhabditis briggsae]|uniref:Protein CBG07070 n=1 Tax=Caenorhabditis briggsae TaxID=6238 RepID=A8X3S2_CAEBR|nr:Protein CBG07070 [Caenorhabditis briggsae]CAP27282.1 Protein CBG07070 [Caenorhabditis briggsae]